MTIYDRSGRLVVMDGQDLASVNLTPEDDGTMVATELKGTGSVKCLITLLQIVAARPEPVLLVVEDSNPRKETLARLYERFGARYMGKVYRTK